MWHTHVVRTYQSGVGLALVEARLHDKETFTGLAHGSATIPLVSFTVGLVDGIDRSNSGSAVAARVVLPGVALTHAVVLGGRGLLVVVLQMALIHGGTLSKELAGDFIVGVVFLIKEPHGVGWGILVVVHNLKGIVPHAFAQVGARRVNVLELGASVFPTPSDGGGKERENGRRDLHVVVVVDDDDGTY
jgi:hypothetical protein